MQIQSSALRILLALIIITAFVSCEKEKDTVSDADISAMTDEATASFIFNDIFNQISNGGSKADQSIGSIEKSTGSGENEFCPEITITPFNLTDWPKTIVLDFGDGCNAGGITRKGKIIMTVSNRFWETGSSWSVGFDNYYVEEHLVEGTKTVTFNGRNSEDNYNWDIVVENANITLPDQSVISWSAQRNREWIDGEQTPFNPADDQFLIRGGSSGVNAAGENYSITITEPLNILLSCPWIRSGVMIIEAGDRPAAEIDFGGGECNSLVTVTVNGHSKEIDLMNHR